MLVTVPAVSSAGAVGCALSPEPAVHSTEPSLSEKLVVLSAEASVEGSLPDELVVQLAVGSLEAFWTDCSQASS